MGLRYGVPWERLSGGGRGRTSVRSTHRVTYVRRRVCWSWPRYRAGGRRIGVCGDGDLPQTSAGGFGARELRPVSADIGSLGINTALPSQMDVTDELSLVTSPWSACVAQACGVPPHRSDVARRVRHVTANFEPPGEKPPAARARETTSDALLGGLTPCLFRASPLSSTVVVLECCDDNRVDSLTTTHSLTAGSTCCNISLVFLCHIVLYV